MAAEPRGPHAHSDDLAAEYEQYLERFEAAAQGKSIEFGSFLKHNGRLVKKFRFPEFCHVHEEYVDAVQAYFDAIDRGDTINDVVVKLIRQRATELIRVSPV